jgi:hypothetical protein
MQHRAATAADAPAIGSKRRTTAEQVVPAHPAVAIAHPGGCRLARRKLREINGTGGGNGNAEQKANGNNRLHYGSVPRYLWDGAWITVLKQKIQFFVHCTVPPNVLTLIALFSHAEMHYRVASQSRHNAGLLTGKTRRARLSSGFYLNDNE